MENKEVPSISLSLQEAVAAPTPARCKLYKRRWLMLLIFVLYSMSNAMQWIQYSIITNIIVKYYDVDSQAVNWTSMIYMITYIPLIFPASWFLDKMGLRVSAILGALGTAAGSWIKVASASADMFVVAFVGQTLVAVSQVFILSVPARLAAVWFGPNEVSSACSVGVFGNQLGIAIGFLLPPVMVKNHDNLEDIGRDLSIMYYSVAGFTTVLLVLIVLFFKAEPPVPPSLAQAEQRAQEDTDFVGSVKRLITNKGYVLLMMSYGLNVGVFYAISTLLNQVVLLYFPNGEEDAGRIGLLMVLAGMLGSVLSGIVLDKTHRFKETTMALYIFSLLGMVVYTFTLSTGQIGIVYFTGAVLGFFMTGYLPVGFELAAELTYPEPEGTSAGILNAAVQVFGILLTNGYSWLLEITTDLWANGALCIALGVGIVLTMLIKSDLRRQAAQGPKLPAPIQ
ncbi:choline/ethanolamine transporter flvcr2b [Periplaneta americana]|uniref:choline/ethanolamine transporter flvcr2b n=1 Tax=Periplaneta americana TaxID=6978 RepID=UPI0037E833B4